jgi:N-acetylmuramic acid 6-phosphate etherase
MSLPADRSHVRTEHRHVRSIDLDALSTGQCVGLFIEDHNAVQDAIRAAATDLVAFIDDLAQRLRRGGRLIYIGAGTSGRLGVLDASECPPTFQSEPGQVIGIIAGGDASLRQSSEGREDEPDGSHDALKQLSIADTDTVLGIAAGGTTPYVLGAFAIAKDLSPRCGTALLTCAAGTSRPPHCDRLVLLDTGPELLTGSTRLKAGSATKLALNIITTTAFIRLGKVYSNLMVDLRASNAKLADRAIRIIQTLCPDLSREAASQLLARAGGAVKPAIVMHHRGIEFQDAQQLLAKHNGQLRAIIG